jgi:hypothetical protein
LLTADSEQGEDGVGGAAAEGNEIGQGEFTYTSAGDDSRLTVVQKARTVDKEMISLRADVFAKV